MAADPRLIFPNGFAARTGARHQTSRQMLETAGRYFELSAECIRRVLDNEAPDLSIKLPALTVQQEMHDLDGRRSNVASRGQSQLLAVIRRAADGGCGKEK